MRAQTGSMRFLDDWTGYFLRGDDALNIVLHLKAIRLEAANALHPMSLKNLDDLIEAFTAVQSPPQATLKEYRECVAEKRITTNETGVNKNSQAAE